MEIHAGIFYSHQYTVAGTLPSANANLLTTSITPKQTEALLRVEFVPTVAGVLTVTYTSAAGVESTALAYGGASLTAGALYPLEILPGASESINFKFYATGGSYRLIVRET